MNDKLQSVLGKLDGYKKEVVTVQTEMTSRPALGPESGGVGEVDKAKWLKQYVEGLGLGVRQINAPDKRVPCGYRPTLVTVLEGQRRSPKVWILVHTDVVPPGDLSNWTGDPWQVRVKGDRLVGRGVEDNQAGLTSALMTLKAFKAAGVTPEFPIGVVLVAVNLRSESSVVLIPEKSQDTLSRGNPVPT